MAAFTYPGVYIEELPSGVHTISGVATSIAAFVGWAPQGPTTEAVLVQSYMDFQRQFGGLDSRSLLGYSVSQFFNNGGQQAYIVRLVQGSTISGTSTSPNKPGTAAINVTGGSVVFTAAQPGAWSNSYGIQISASSGDTFTASVVYAPAGAALVTLPGLSFPGLSVSPISSIPPNNYVTLTATGTPTAAPANGLYMITGGNDGNGISVPEATAASVTIHEPSSTTSGFTFTASNPGAWGNLVAISATPQSSRYGSERYTPQSERADRRTHGRADHR